MFGNYNELLNIFPKDIAELILQYGGPLKKWAVYWKDYAMEMINSRPIRSLPQSLYFMNEVYLSNLTYGILGTHIQLLMELNTQYIYNTNFTTLLRAIKNNIKFRLRNSSLPNGMKLSILWMPS